MAKTKQLSNNSTGPRYIDLTETGPLSYRELRALNNNLPEESEFNALIPDYAGVLNMLDRAGRVNYTLQHTGLGDSMFDPKVANQNLIENLLDYRAEAQPWYAQLGAGIAKGTILAGTTFLDGTLGLLFGTALGVANLFDNNPNSGFWNGLWNNDFSKAMLLLNEASEQWMPNYYSLEELNSPWYTNILTSNFLGDKLIKNLGFSIGALYSGGVFGAATKAIKLPLLVGYITNSTKAPKMVTSAIGGFTSAVNEGRIEALNNSGDWAKLKTQELEDNWRERLNTKYAPDMLALEQEYKDALEEYEATKGDLSKMYMSGTGENMTLVDPAKEKYLRRLAELDARKASLQLRMNTEWSNRDLDPAYRNTLAKIELDRLRMGNMDLLMNIPILTASNIFQFAKFYSNGFNTARRAGVKTVTNEAGRITGYAGKSFSKATAARKVVQGALAEGTEEISQKAASLISGNYYSTDVNNFYKALIDKDAELETLSFMKTVATGINETWNDGSSWEEFFIGSLTGLLGVPSFRSMKGADGKLRSPITILGGAINEIREYQEELKRSEEIANYLNKRVLSPEFLNYYRGLIRHNKYLRDMSLAVEDDDAFDYKNAEHAQFMSDIIMFDNAGKLDDLRDLIDVAYDVSDENLDSIVKNTTTIEKVGEEDKKVGPFIDSTGSPMSKEEMIDKLTLSRKSMLDTLDNYKKIKNDLDIRTGGKLSNELLSEMAWILSQIDDWSNRAESMAPLVKRVLTNVSQNLLSALSTAITSASYLGTEAIEGTVTMSSLYGISLERIKLLEELVGLNDKQLTLLLTHPKNIDFVEGLIDTVSRFGSDIISSLDRDNVVRLLEDLPRIGLGRKIFNDKLEEYLTDPAKIVLELAKATEEVKLDIKEKASLDIRTRLSQATSIKDFREALSQLEDRELSNSIVEDLIKEGNKIAKNYKEVSQYDTELRKAISELDETDLAVLDALTLWKEQTDRAEDLKLIANPNSVTINDNSELFLLDSGGRADVASARFEEARYVLQKAMSKVNNDIKFKDRFSPEYKKPASKKSEGILSSTSTSSGNTSNNLGSSGSNLTNSSTDSNLSPSGNITIEEVAKENKELNERVETRTAFDDKLKGKKRYYRPAIPELHIEASKQGDFRPFDVVVAEREPGVDFSEIYKYLRDDNGAFDYVNSGKLKAGDTILFMIDPKFEESVKDKPWHKAPTVFLTTEDGQVVGSLDEGPSIDKYEGLRNIIEKVRLEYLLSVLKALQESQSSILSLDTIKTQEEQKEEANLSTLLQVLDQQASQNNQAEPKRFFATLSTRVSKIMVGRVPYIKEERSLADTPGITDSTKKPIFGIIKNGILDTNGKVDSSLIIHPMDMSREGRLYLLIPNAAGTFSPSAVRVKHFNNEEFNLSDPTVVATPIGESINEAFTKLAEVSSLDDIARVMKELLDYLYILDVMVTWFDAAAGSGIVISKKVKNPDGTYEYITIDGLEKIKEEKVSIYFLSSRKEAVINGITWSYETALKLGADMSVFGQLKSVEEIKGEILNAFLKFNLPLLVNVSRINDPVYNDRIIESNILTSNLREARVIDNWFTTDYIDSNGNILKAVNPPSVKPTNNSGTSPVGGTNSVVLGTRVTVNGNNYIVDLKLNIIVEESTGKKLNLDTSGKYAELAWALETFGDATESSLMTDNKVITPSGKVLDRTTGLYLNDEEAQKIKDKIAGRNKDIEARVTRAERIRAEILENQLKVDKTKTDKDYYYILEEDGQYHLYSRVHSVLGGNRILSEKLKKELDNIRVTLAKVIDNLDLYNAYIRALEKKYSHYAIDFSSFIDKTDAQTRETIVSIISDKMLGTSSQRSLIAGTAVDLIIRDFFTSGKVPVRPDIISEEAFNTLIAKLTDIKSKMELFGQTFLTNNIVLFLKYPDGTRIAGEVDILSVDKNGNFRIYDVKTSGYSFGEFVDKYGHHVNYFKDKARTQRMSTELYYTLQLSAYLNLFESLYGVRPVKLAILPFVLSYDTNDKVISVEKEAGIPITYNPAVNVPLIKRDTLLAEPKKEDSLLKETLKKESLLSLPIFDPSIETMNPENRVLPENAFEEGGEVGFYEMDGKLYTGYLKKMGEIEVTYGSGQKEMVPVYVTKVRDRGTHSGKLGSTSEYLTVFPNGKAISTLTNDDNDSRAIETIMKALSVKPEKVLSLSNEGTQIYNPRMLEELEILQRNSLYTPNTPSELSRALNTVLKEMAINKRSAKRTRHKLRAVDTTREVWDLKKELTWLSKVLPQLSEQDRVRVVLGLIQVSENGPVAWGMFSDGIITLSDIAAKGTTYHEAFHVVFNLMLSLSEREALFVEARQKFGDKSNLELEEDMAEGFREYVVSLETAGFGRRIINFFKNLFAKIKNWVLFKPSLYVYYSMINLGKYAGNSISLRSETRLREEEYTSEMLDIKKRAIADGSFMKAPNGNPTNLTERLWLQVRTQNFINWFGDWINNPAEASKVVDENGEPLVVYHGSKSILNVFDPSKSESRQYLSQQIKPTNFFSSDETVADFFALTENQRLASQISKSISIVLDAFAGENVDEDILADEIWTYAARRTGKSKEFVKDFWENKVPREYKMYDDFGTTRMEDPDINKYKYNVFLNMKSPIILDAKGERADRFIEANKEILNNNDEVIIINIDETVGKKDTATDYLVRNPNQIKSATDNIGEFSTTNNDIRYRLVEGSESLNDENYSTIKTEALKFLDNFGITLREVREYTEETPLFDAINRIINFRTAEDITEGVGYAVAFMMLHNSTMQLVMEYKLASTSPTFEKGIRRSIKNRKDYTPSARKRDLSDSSIRDSILREVGKDIASLLRILYKLEDIDAKPTTYFLRIWDVIKLFFELLTPLARLKFDVITNYTKNIANSIKLNDPSIVVTRKTKPGTNSPAYRVNIERALKENPYEEDIITKLNKEGIALAGSASIALMGTVYRPIENPLHDIDFLALPFENKSLLDEAINRLFSNNTHIRTIQELGYTTETYLILDRPFTTKRPVSNIAVIEIYDLKTGEKLGSYVGSELVLKDGVKGKFLDFFMGKPKFAEPTVKILNGKPYLISDYRNALKAKIELARVKDIWDYNRFIPNTFDYSLVEERKEQERQRTKELISNARIIWGHPAIGKTTYLENNQDILEWDQEVNEKRNRFFRELIDPEHRMNIDSREYKELRSKYMSNWRNHPEYIEFLTKEWNALKRRAMAENKRLFASPSPLLEMFGDQMDLVVNIPESSFLQRNVGRGGTYIGSMAWKQGINRALVLIDPNKVVTTDKYFSEFMRENLGVLWGTLTREELDFLTEKGWTKLEFDKISLAERDLAVRCAGL